jgi:ribosomal protein L24E
LIATTDEQFSGAGIDPMAGELFARENSSILQVTRPLLFSLMKLAAFDN